MNEKPNFERIIRMISFKDLVNEIYQLESEGIIEFDKFENLPYIRIQEQFFLMPSPKQILKAKIKIRDQKNGKTGESILVTTKEVVRDGKIVKTDVIEYF